jgi:hypothetical protein
VFLWYTENIELKLFLTMDKKSKVLLWVLALLIVGSVAVTFWRIMIKKDYVIEAQADCDPTTEKCFVAQCDPTAETCTGDPEKDTSYFKKVSRLAYNIPLCDPADETCQALVCPEGEKDCAITLCDEKTKSKDEECSDPEQYNIDHPAVDESTTCAEGDTECAAAADASATCDPEQDPTCVDGASATDASAGADATATDSTTPVTPDATAVQQ